MISSIPTFGFSLSVDVSGLLVDQQMGVGPELSGINEAAHLRRHPATSSMRRPAMGDWR